jgi:hypothetical protein
MRTSLIALAALALLGQRVDAASVTLGLLADNEDGTSYGLDAQFAPTDNWYVGAGVGKSESSLSGADFSGTSLRLATDVTLGAFSAGVSMQRWKDSSQLQSTDVLGQVGWLANNGLSFSALLDDRRMTVQYTATVLGQTQEREIDFEGSGYGADISWFGESWNLGVRYLDYSYGRSVDRVRAVLESTSTDRFPRLQLLMDSVVTRAAGAPDRQFTATLGRNFGRSSLQGDFGQQRDALTGTKVKSLSLTHGYSPGKKVHIDTTLGFSDGGVNGTVAFAGLSLTLGN